MKPNLFPLLTASLLALPTHLSAERLRLTNDHVDLQVVSAVAGTNVLALVLHNEDQGLTFAATNAVLIVPESAKLTVPDSFPDLGPAGSDLWVLPASQDPSLLHLGISAEDLDLPAQPVDVFVRRVDGPGHFLAWQFDGADGLRLGVSTRDGLTEADRFTPQVGGHEHHNFGFGTNGHFTVWLQARATVNGTNAWSPETPFLFAVKPVPALTPFQEWQGEQWPGITDPTVIGPDADPDADGRNNLLEYAHGLNPNAADATRPVFLTLQTRDGKLTGAFTHRRAKRATDVQFVVEAASTPDGPWQPLVIPDDLDDDGEAEWVTWLDSVAVADASVRFYRVRVTLRP